MGTPTVNLTRVQLSRKSVGAIALIATIVLLLVGFLLAVFGPTVYGWGHKIGAGIKRQADRVTPGQPTNAHTSATAGMA